MKKQINKLPRTLLFLFLLLSSCNEKSKIENIFISNPKEYWKFEDNCGGYGIFFKFHEDGHYDKYIKCIDEGFHLFNNDGDIRSGPRNWSIINDSTFLWNKREYTIEKCSSKQIILSYNFKNSNVKNCQINFVKVTE